MLSEVKSPQAIAIFDLDGTLLRGSTVCEVLADRLGHGPRMREIEQLRDRDDIVAARHEMAEWYRGFSREELRLMSLQAVLASDARNAIASLQQSGVKVAIASITWLFAVEAFAKLLGIQRFIGTDMSSENSIAHVWPEDKAVFLRSLAEQAQLPVSRVFAIGDTVGDVPMLNAAGHGYFVGQVRPATLRADRMHVRDGSLIAIAQDILSRVSN